MLQAASVDQGVSSRPPGEAPGRVRATRSLTGSWNGVRAEVTALCGPGRYLDDLRSPYAQLVVMLEQIGGRAEMRLRPDQPGRSDARATDQLSFIPGNMPAWGYADPIRYLRRMRVSFDASRVASVIGEEPGQLAPRLMFSDPRVLRLAELLAAECENSESLDQLYGDSLAAALTAGVLRPAGAARPERRSGGLAPWQLRRITDYIEDHVCDAIQLRGLAAMIGLSQSHFAHAFKASTGMPPHRWQLHARIARAKRLLVDGNAPLARVAIETGFAAQSHFTRVFRRIVGTTPRAWQRALED
jgi:AraC-like DNA-binding protein